MRIAYTLFLGSALAWTGLPASAQQSDWNHPSQQQQDDTKDFSKSVKDGMNDLGSAETPSPSGQSDYPNPAGGDQSHIHDQVHDLVKQGSGVLDSLPDIPGR